MIKVVIIGSGLSGLICANLFKKKDFFDVYLLEKHNLNINKLDDYYKLKKKNLHPHAFTSVFCYYLKKYLPELYFATKNKSFIDKLILRSIDVSKKDFNNILFKNINKKINFYNKVLDLKFQFKNRIVSEIKFFSDKKYYEINDVDFVLDCSGVNSYYENILKKTNNLKINKISKNRFFSSIFFKINDRNNLTRLNKLLLNKNITIYEDDYNLSIIKYNNNFSATFVSGNQEFKDKNYSKKILNEALMKYDIENILVSKNLKWFHLNSSFLKFKNTNDIIKNIIPIGECFMKTNPEHGNGSTLSILQAIYVFSKIQSKFNLNEYIDVFFDLFKLLEKNNIFIKKNSNRKILKKIIPFYFEFRFLFYFYFLEKKKFQSIINLLN